MSENNLQGRLAEYRTQKGLHGLQEEVDKVTTPIGPRPDTSLSDVAAAVDRLNSGISTELQPPTITPAQIESALRTVYGSATSYSPEQRSEVISRISLGLPIEAPIVPRPDLMSWQLEEIPGDTIDTDEQYQAALQQVGAGHEVDKRTPSPVPPKPVDLDPYKVVRAEPNKTKDKNRHGGNPELLSEPISLDYSIGDLLTDTEITDRIEEFNRYELNIGLFRRNFSGATADPQSADRFLEQYRLQRYFSADQITPENYGKMLGIIRARALIERQNYSIRRDALFSPEVTRATREAIADMEDLTFGNTNLINDIQKARQDIAIIMKNAEDSVAVLRERKALKVPRIGSEKVNKLTSAISDWQFRTANRLPAKFIPDLRRHVANSQWDLIKLKYNIPDTQFDKDKFLAYICFEESFDQLKEQLEPSVIDKLAQLHLDTDELSPSTPPPRP